MISTPYWCAEEMLAEDRGVLVPFHDPAALAEVHRQVVDRLRKMTAGEWVIQHQPLRI